MSEIVQLGEKLRERFPTILIELDLAENPRGSSWLDATLDGHHVVAESKPGRGFGISTPSREDYGSGPDEVYDSAEAAFERLKEILLGQIRTRRPRELSLPEVRESRELSQVELAGRLRVTQSALSRMERRSDMLINTLRSAITAMGGELEVRATFPEGDVVRIRIGDDSEPGDDRGVREAAGA